MANAKSLDPRALRWAARLARRRAYVWDHVDVRDGFTSGRAGSYIAFARELESELRKVTPKPSVKLAPLTRRRSASHTKAFAAVVAGRPKKPPAGGKRG